MSMSKLTDLACIVILALLAVAVLGFLSTRVAGQGSHHHPPEDVEMHEKFYSSWMRPDQPQMSCCGKGDCYKVEARHENGTWYAKRREDGKWLAIPAEKVERNRDMPDQNNHLCAPPPNHPYYPADHVFCFGYSSGI